MNITRFPICPCCQSIDFSVYYCNKMVTPINSWQQFFYGSSSYIKDISICNICKFKFINSISPNYEKHYKEQLILENSNLDPYRHAYFKKIKHQLHKKFPNMSSNMAILDVGCSKGIWLDLWKNKADVYGSEYSTQCLDVLQKKHISILEPHEIKQKKFDIISLFDVLEHIENPHTFLQEITKSLNSGGVLIIGVPDMGKLLAKLLRHKYYLICPMHFSYFDKHSLQLLLQKLFQSHNIHIEKSPRMNSDLQGISRWLHFLPKINPILNVSIPIPYRASLLCFCIKG